MINNNFYSFIHINSGKVLQAVRNESTVFQRVYNLYILFTRANDWYLHHCFFYYADFALRILLVPAIVKGKNNKSFIIALSRIYYIISTIFLKYN